MKLPVRDPLSREWFVVLVAFALFGVLWVWQVYSSEGFLEADACSHFLIARFAFDEPYRFVDVWGRPFKTALYALPARLMGRLGVQAASLVLATTCAFVAMLLAKDYGLKRPSLAFVFTLAIPLVFFHSFSELTELPFAALLAVAFYAYARRWTTLAAILASLLPLSRPEGFGILFLVGLLFLYERQWLRILLLPLGLVIWSVAGHTLYGEHGGLLGIMLWIPHHWPYAGDSVYQRGSLFHFIALLPALVGPIQTPALLMGMWQVARNTNYRQLAGSHEARWKWLLLGLPVFVLAAHSVLYTLGKMASNGELRYMLVVAPFWGVLVAIGWERAFDLLARSPREMIRFAGYAALVPLFVNLRYFRVLPIEFNEEWPATKLIARWADRFGRANGYPAIMAGHPGVYYFLDRSQNDKARAREFIDTNVHHPPPGTILLYDPIYCRFNSDRARRIDSEDELKEYGWVLMPIPHLGDWKIYLSPEKSDQPR